jgi:glutathione synthase/RimK-type ligase-like ATP-grasp enzyme
MARPRRRGPRSGPRLAFATWRGLSELNSDDRRAAEALRHRGALVDPVVWDTPGLDWSDFDAVVVRSVWDYHLRPVEFLRWVDRVEEAGTRLLNPPGALRWNHHKSYLRDLAARGVATVPTAWLDRGSRPDLGGVLGERGWAEAVVKPAVSASAHETWRTSAAAAAADQGRLRRLLLAGDVLVQPLVPEVQSPGEWSLVFFGGSFSHAMLKRPREGDFRVQEELGGRAEWTVPVPALVEQAARALAAAPAPCLYARVDGVERDGRLILMEMELIEPVLYFEADPGAAGRFAEAGLALAGGPVVHSKTE